MTRTGALGVVLALVVAAPAAAQTSFVFGGGITKPTGEYGDYAKTGWLATVGINRSFGGKGAWFGGEVVYGSNKHSDFAGDKTNLPGVLADLGYRFGDKAKVGPYLYASAGAINHQFRSTTDPSENEWGFAYGAGAGVDVPIGRAALWLEVRYLGRSGTNFIPIMAGFSVPLGK